MKKSVINILVSIILLVQSSCTNYYDRSEYKWTTKISDSLFVETFCVSGYGVYSTDVVSHYITDSMNFYQYVGTFSEGDEYLLYLLEKDILKVKKIESNAKVVKVIDSSLFSIKKLKQKINF